MKIALDYDNTFSLDPVFWEIFIHLAKMNGHEVRIVTARDERFDRTMALAGIESHLPVIYTRGVAKKWFLSHFGDGFIPGVWIDDKPESILTNSDFSPEGLVEWRAVRGEGEVIV